MHQPDAQAYIDTWRALAALAGLFAFLGAVVGLVGSVRAWGTMRRVRGAAHSRGMAFVAVGDLVLLTGLTVAAVVQVGVSAGLVAISARYPTDLSVVLVALDGLVTGAYTGYVVQVALVNLVAPAYLAFRTLALLEQGQREHGGC